MALLKRYTEEHRAAIADSRREVREAINRVKKAESVAPTLAKRKPRAKKEAE